MDRLIQGLLRADAYDHPVGEIELLETHISWVILTGTYAYKLKKPVDFGFVNFTTLELRKHFCHEELRLNRRLARDLYLDVRPIYGSAETPTFQKSGSPIEYAVQMQQFPQSALLPEVLSRGELNETLLDRLALDVADFQRTAVVADRETEFGSPETVLFATTECLHPLAGAKDFRERIRDLAAWTDTKFTSLQSLFLSRKELGFVREGHGDMHLGNMLLRGDRIEIFDCLEFNASLRWIDIISEVAFLVMDLEDRGRGDFGWRFLNAWLEEIGDYEGLQLWNWYSCYRALVRAKVAFLRLGQSDLEQSEREHQTQELNGYLELAELYASPTKPRLVITSGVSGSGKSHWTQQLAARCGFIRLRSDVERKRLFADYDGSKPAETSEKDLYSANATDATYSRLLEISEMLLQAGFSVLVDATFLRRDRREKFRELASRLKVPAELIEFKAPVEILYKRVRDRQRLGQDPSDADQEVLNRQLASREDISPDEGWSVLTLHTDEPQRVDALLKSFFPLSRQQFESRT